MTTYPRADFRPLATAQRQPRMTAHDIVCLHTMVGTLTGTDRMFHANGWSGTESHFGIGGKWGDGRDGEIIQWQDTEFTADANLDGNHRVISIETGDNFPRAAADIEPWTAKQLDSIVAVTAWACRKYDIPAVLIPDSKPGRRGIGYHRLGIDPWRVPGGEKWSSARGKECPADQRIAQMPQIVARVKAVLAGEEDDMPSVAEIVAGLRPTIRAEVRAQLIDVLQNEPLITNKPTAAALAADPDAAASQASVTWFLGNIEADQDNDRDTDREARARLEGKVDQLLQLLATPGTPAAG